MEKKERSSEKAPRGKWILSLIHTFLSYYSKLVSEPIGSGLAYFVAGLIPALLIGWVLFPMVLYSEQEQPINFSHAIHTDPDIIDGMEGYGDLEKCLFCHGFRDDGTFEGIPKLERCMECHDDPEFPLGESYEEEEFLKYYVAYEKEVPWFYYYRQPDCVYFSHIAHVKMSDLECRTCHGDHAQTHELPVYKKNILTNYSINIWGKNIAGFKSNTWDRMKMDDCAECHYERGKEENNACFVCHK
jgi:hypothetical protein